MIITCPECKFEREVNLDKIPARAQTATCPKCKTKFKFREIDDEFDFKPESVAQAPAKEPAEEAPGEPEASQAKPAAAEPEKTDQEAPTEPPASEDLLPGLDDPSRDRGEELWDKLGVMTPPEERRREEGEKKSPAGYDDAPLPDWARKREEEAAQAEQAAQAVQEEEVPVVKPPFEDLERFGFFPGLFETIKRIVLAPRMFFDVMPLGNGIGRPMVFALLIILIHDLFNSIYIYAGLVPPPQINGQTAEFMTDSLGMQMGLVLLLSPVAGAVALFAAAWLYHAVLSILRAANGGFEATFRAVAYSTPPLLLGLIPEVNTFVQQGSLIASSSWFMVLVIIAWKHLHRTTYLKAGLTIVLPVLVMMVLVFFSMSYMPTV